MRIRFAGALALLSLPINQSQAFLQTPNTAIFLSSLTTQAPHKAMTLHSNAQGADNAQCNDPESKSQKLTQTTPRTRSIMYMVAAMSLHFGGYEFIRNACIGLFTSSTVGFSSPVAFPLASGLVSPFSVLLLLIYTRQLDKYGPRVALKHTNVFSIMFIAVAAGLLQYGGAIFPKSALQLIMGVTFLYQNSFQYLIYTQQWSFLGSVMTPDEGAKWFASFAGLCSVTCTITGGICLPFLIQKVGLTGLMATTCITLLLCTICCDRAYSLAQQHGFDPAKKSERKSLSTNDTVESSKLSQAVSLFKRVPTLRALLVEVLSFQSLNTILNIAFVRSLQHAMPTNDAARSAYSGRLYSLINLSAAFFQFLLFPLVLKKVEPRSIWRVMPLFPLGLTIFQAIKPSSSTAILTCTAAAYFCGKLTDYAIRTVVYPMAYQPLDFESRYVGKEIIGVVGSRFGKSGMSIILSLFTALNWTGLQQLQFMSLGVSVMWTFSAYWLSNLIPLRADAQASVEKRQKKE